MALSKVKMDDLDDPFDYLPVEIRVMITKYLGEDPRDLLYLALASPSFRKLLSYRDLNSFRTIYHMQASWDGYQYPSICMGHIRANMSFVRNQTDGFQEAFQSVISQRFQPWPQPLHFGDVVLVLAPDAHVADQFSAFFEERGIPGFEVLRDNGGRSVEAVSKLRKSAMAVVVIVSHRTDGFLPKPTLAVALDPAGAKCVQRILHLGPGIFNVIWSFNDRVGRNYAAVRKLLHAFNRNNSCQLSYRKPVVRLLPEGNVVGILFLFGLVLALMW